MADTKTWRILPDGSGDALSIQAGIDSAAAGDTVLALPGRYYENIDFKGKAIVVQGSGPAVTILDGSGREESCVLFTHGEGRQSVLTGFEITHGHGHGAGGTRWGGGIFALGAEPTIRGNTVVGNFATSLSGGRSFGDGGGLYFIADSPPVSPLIEGNTIWYNQAGSNGGGIACAANVAPEIRDNVVLGNEAVDGDGGGIWLFTSVDGALVENNRVTKNLSGDHGGGIFVDGERSSYPYVSYEIRGNLLAGNFAEFASGFLAAGGGMVLSAADAWVHHNTLVDNWGHGPTSTYGGGIAVDDSPGTVIEQNIIALSTSGGGIFCYSAEPPGAIRDNLAWQNVGGDGTGSCATWWQTNGNVVADPHFCDPDVGEYTVAENSPALLHPAAPLGAFGGPGCGPVTVRFTTWGRIKALYR